MHLQRANAWMVLGQGTEQTRGQWAGPPRGGRAPRPLANGRCPVQTRKARRDDRIRRAWALTLACARVCMYVLCRYVSMYVSMYVCMCVCMHVYMYICMYVYMYACIYACMYICMYICMYVCMYLDRGSTSTRDLSARNAHMPRRAGLHRVASTDSDGFHCGRLSSRLVAPSFACM